MGLHLYTIKQKHVMTEEENKQLNPALKKKEKRMFCQK